MDVKEITSNLLQKKKERNFGEKRIKATRLTKTCLPGQPLDRSWAPGQPLDRSERDQIGTIKYVNLLHFRSIKDVLDDSLMILHVCC